MAVDGVTGKRGPVCRVVWTSVRISVGWDADGRFSAMG